jgi:hypothetical protein
MSGDTEPMPILVQQLRRDRHGRPVPWFVADIDGVPDFRIIAAGKIAEALRDELCWICGRPLTLLQAFVIGPMCAVNRATAEPPCHTLCALYAARACPFIVRPNMVRRERRLPAHVEPPGVMIRRNPGVVAVWVTDRYDVWFPRPDEGPLIRIGTPLKVDWFREGRTATRFEVATSMGEGLADLRQAAIAEGPKSVLELDSMVKLAEEYLPARALGERL